MSIKSYTGNTVNDTIRNKLKQNEKRYISVNTFFNNTQNEYNNIRIRCLYKILNKRVTLINNNYRNYEIRSINKLNICYKRLVLHLPFNDNTYICNDIIEKIFNSLIILKK